MTMKTPHILLPTLLALVLLTGCVGNGSYDARAPAAAATGKVGQGSSRAFIVGVYQDRVDRDGACALSDWRVSFTTEYSQSNGTYVYDTKNAREFSVSNDSALLAKLNETMKGDAPVFLTWQTVADRGCQYEHREVVSGVAPITNSVNATTRTPR